MYNNILSASIYNVPTKSILTLKHINMFQNPLPGSEIGIPLFFIEKIFTDLHYNYNINNFNLLLFQSTVGYLTYGSDRFFDSFSINWSDSKKDLYLYFQSNKNFIIITLSIAYLKIVFDLLHDVETIPFIFLLTSTFWYKNIKKEYGEFKAVYIATFWTISSIILPCVINDHNYHILKDPINYLPCFLNILASSNLLDLKDLEEDLEEGINTLPVKYGITNTTNFSIFCLFLSFILVLFNENYNIYPIQTSLYEIQNLGLIYAAYNKTFIK